MDSARARARPSYAAAMRPMPAAPADAGEVLTLQRAAFAVEAQRYRDPFLPPLVEPLESVLAAVVAGDVLVGLRVVQRAELALALLDLSFLLLDSLVTGFREWLRFGRGRCGLHGMRSGIRSSLVCIVRRAHSPSMVSA